jgi:hypothetical protein
MNLRRMLIGFRGGLETSTEIDEKKRRQVIKLLTPVIDGEPEAVAQFEKALAEFMNRLGSNLAFQLQALKRVKRTLDRDELGDLLFFEALKQAASESARSFAKKAPGAAAGRKSSTARNLSADKRWRNEVAQQARQILTKRSKGMSTHALTSEIITRWEGEADALPSERTVYRFVTNLRRSGKI